MKLYATIKNERGGKKSTGDDTRIIVELHYKNKIVGEVGFYRIWDKGEDLGFRVVWKDETTVGARKLIREEEKDKEQRYCEAQVNEDFCLHCATNKYGYCDKHHEMFKEQGKKLKSN